MDRRLRIDLAVAALSAALSVGLTAGLAPPVRGGPPVPPPTDWELRQNEPNPYCGATAISLVMKQAADVTLRVWDPSSTTVIRTLIDGELLAGVHQVIWDGRDASGTSTADGSYPYEVRITELGTGQLLFTKTLAAIHSCAAPARPLPWGLLKQRFE